MKPKLGILLILLCETVFLAKGKFSEDSESFVLADVLRDFPGQCFDAYRCALKNEGQTWTVNKKCEEATCYKATNGTLLEKRTRCEPLKKVPSNGCYVIRIEGMTFPECCPKLYCDDENYNRKFDDENYKRKFKSKYII